MSRKEIAYAKSSALATRDWDTFQAIIRKCLKERKTAPKKQEDTRHKPRI